jgi:hypothetical protein
MNTDTMDLFFFEDKMHQPHSFTQGPLTYRTSMTITDQNHTALETETPDCRGRNTRLNPTHGVLIGLSSA